MKRIIGIGVMAIVLVFALAPSLAAQTRIRKNFGGRSYDKVTNGTIVVYAYSVNNQRGSNEVFQPVDGYRGAPNGKKVTLSQLKLGKGYCLSVPKDHRVDLGGADYDDNTKLQGKLDFIIEGPSDLFFWVIDEGKTPILSFDFVAGSPISNIYVDSALYVKTLHRDYINKYIVPTVNYSKMVEKYNDVKKTSPIM